MSHVNNSVASSFIQSDRNFMIDTPVKKQNCVDVRVNTSPKYEFQIGSIATLNEAN